MSYGSYIPIWQPTDPSRGYMQILGFIFTEYLAFSIMAKYAQRALGMLIAKSKTHGGMPYSVVRKLFDSLVQPSLTMVPRYIAIKYISACKQPKTEQTVIFRSG